MNRIANAYRWLRWTAFVCVSLIVTYLVLWIVVFIGIEVVYSPFWWPNDKFTSSAWKTSPAEERYRFYQDLDRSDRLFGLSEKEVRSLLGEPDSIWPNPRRINYIIKHRSSGEWTFNSVYFLQLEFDSTGRVASISIEAD